MCLTPNENHLIGNETRRSVNIPVFGVAVAGIITDLADDDALTRRPKLTHHVDRNIEAVIRGLVRIEYENWSVFYVVNRAPAEQRFKCRNAFLDQRRRHA